MTPAQLRMLEAIKAHVAQYKMMPTIRELQRVCDYKSSSGAFHRLEKLVETGYLRRVAGARHRASFALTDKAYKVGRDRASALTDAELVAEVARRGGIYSLVGETA